MGAWVAFTSRRLAAWREGTAGGRVELVCRRVVVPLAAVSAPAQNSHDSYRYVWDGRYSRGHRPVPVRPHRDTANRVRNEFLFYPRRPVMRQAEIRKRNPAAD